MTCNFKVEENFILDDVNFTQYTNFHSYNRKISILAASTSKKMTAKNVMIYNGDLTQYVFQKSFVCRSIGQHSQYIVS